MYNRGPGDIERDGGDLMSNDDRSEVFSVDLDQRIQTHLHIKGSEKTSAISYAATFWDVLCFGICVTSANIFIDWSTGFSNGYWDFLFTSFISASVFICLHLCLAEMVSIIPYSGGTYAIARVTVGPFLGYVVGCLESIGNIIFVLVAMMPIGTNITYIFGGDAKYEPIYWFIAYSLVIAMEFAGRKHYFTFLRTMAFLSIALLVLYLIVSAQDVNIDAFIPQNVSRNTYRGGITDFLSIYPISGWYYYGLEIMPLVCDEVKEAKVAVPRAIVVSLIIVTIFAFTSMVCAYAQYPGYLDDIAVKEHNLPLNSGFSNAFNIDDRMATLFSYLALYISNALFIYGYGKQLSALGKSKLLPTFLSWTVPNSKIPYMALIVGSLAGFIPLVIIVTGCGLDYNSALVTNLFNMAMIGTYSTFMIMFISFIIFRTRYDTLPRSFHNPLGVYGAIYGMGGVSLLLVSIIGFSNDQYLAISYFSVFLGIIIIYYFSYARYNQVFSDEEQSVLFVVYLLNANKKKNLAIKRKHARTLRSHRLHDNESSISSHLWSGRRQLKVTRVVVMKREEKEDSYSRRSGGNTSEGTYRLTKTLDSIPSENKMSGINNENNVEEMEDVASTPSME